MSQEFSGKKALIFGIANERSLAWSIAQSLHERGAEIAVTYAGEALERRVRPLAEKLGSTFIEPCDVGSDSDLDTLFGKVKDQLGSLDMVIHSIGFANKQDLEGRFVDTSREGFQLALDISAYSLVAITQRAEPFLEASQGSVVTLSYYGAEKVVPNYNVMGVAKSALESSVRYLANDLGPKGIRVNAISAGPVKTLAAAGIRNFRTMLNEAKEKTPLRETIDGQDVGEMAAFLCGKGGRHITGATFYVDSGAHIMGA